MEKIWTRAVSLTEFLEKWKQGSFHDWIPGKQLNQDSFLDWIPGKQLNQGSFLDLIPGQNGIRQFPRLCMKLGMFLIVQYLRIWRLGKGFGHSFAMLPNNGFLRDALEMMPTPADQVR
jgi:hypothetical protein